MHKMNIERTQRVLDDLMVYDDDDQCVYALRKSRRRCNCLFDLDLATYHFLLKVLLMISEVKLRALADLKSILYGSYFERSSIETLFELKHVGDCYLQTSIIPCVGNLIAVELLEEICWESGMHFDITFFSLNPDFHVVAPWRECDIAGREDYIEHAKKHNVPIPVTKKSIYGRDMNLCHLSHEDIEQMKPEIGVLQEREVQRTSLLETTKLKYELLDNSSGNGKEKKLARK
ncbi:argininosuccinate synthase, chloroplastic isoform X1, partial [Tanacetum coccineum]